MDDVIPFDATQVTVKPARAERCYHGWRSGYVVDEEKRTIECKACGAVLDPIQSLIDIARGQKWADQERQRRAKT